MKPIYKQSVRLLALLLLSSIPSLASAYDFMVDGLCYNINEDGTSVTVTYEKVNNNGYGNGYNDLSGDLEIPSSVTYNGTTYSVTSIGNRAFYGCTGLTSVTIPNSVTSIGGVAFYRCTGMTSVNISDLAAWCNIDFSNGDSNPLRYAHNLYLNGSKVTDLIIPNMVTAIKGNAFNGGTCFTSVTIPNSVTSIGGDAFSLCTSLTSVYINDLAAWCNIDFSNVSSNPLSCAHNLYLNGSKVADLIIPNSVITIDDYAFSSCSGLTSVTIGNSVKTIGYAAFYDCSGLTSVTIGISVTSIGEQAFRGCTGLTSVAIGNSVTSIGSSAFYCCSGLTSVNINDLAAWCNIDFSNGDSNPLKYAHNLYLNGSKVTDLVIPNSVTAIKGNAFNGGTCFTSVTIGNSVTSIGEAAFYGCSGMTSIVVESENTEYDSRNNCNAIIETATNTLLVGCKNTTIPSSVTSIGNRAFLGLSSLSSIVIPNSVLMIDDFAFYNCIGLTSVTIPNSVTSIGDYAFKGCSSLTSVKINDLAAWCNIDFSNGDSNPLSCAHNLYLNGSKVTDLVIPYTVAAIKQNAFNGGTCFTSVTVPNSVTSIYQSAFSGCTAMTSVTLNCNSIVSKNHSTSNNIGNLFGSQVHEYIIGDDVTSIGAVAFWRCTNMTSVSIGNSVTSIGGSAFSNCTGLSSVTIGNSVTTIDYHAFVDCTSLTSVTIPNSVTSIGYGAFLRCSGLTSVTIGNSVTSIGYGAFSDCTGLTSVNINDLAAWCNIDFSNSSSNPLSYAHNLYLNGSKVTDLVIPNSVTAIKKYSFYAGTSLTSVTIPNSVTSIGDYAFYGCSGLTSVTIPNSVTSIGNSAFYNCSALSSVTIGNSVTSIGNYAFNSCTGLTSVNINDLAAWCNIDFSTGDSNPLYYAHNLYLNGSKVTDLVIPNSVTAIKQYAFEDCIDLNSVIISNSVTSIGKSAFYGCSGLNSVTIGISVLSIGNSAFYNCSGITTIYSRIMNPQNVSLGSYIFFGINKSDCVLIVPGPSLSLYQEASQWNEFLNIYPLDCKMDIGANVSHVRGMTSNKYELSVNMDNFVDITGVEFDISMPTGVSLATDSYGYYDVWLDDDRKARNHSVSVEALSGNKYKVLIASPTAKTFSGNSGDILHMNIKIDQYHSATGDYAITLSNIVMAEPDETQHNPSNAHSNVRLCYLVGDANADVEVDVSDFVVTANHILGRTPSTLFFGDAANAAYNNNAINVTDLVAITNIALELREKEIMPAESGYQKAPAIAMPGTDYSVTADVVEKSSDKTVVAIAVDNDEPIAAMQLDLDLPEGITLESAAVADRTSGMSASCGTSPEGKARIILSSFSDNEVDCGMGDVLLLTLNGAARQGDLLQLNDIVMAERNLIEHSAAGELTLDLNDITGVNIVGYDNVNIYAANGCVVIESPVEGTAKLVRINGMSREVKVEPGRNVYPVNVTRGDIVIATFNGTTRKIQF